MIVMWESGVIVHGRRLCNCCVSPSMLFILHGDDSRLVCSNWLEAPKQDQLKGKPLRCQLCKNTILLNAASLKMHIASKRHQRALQGEHLRMLS